MKIPALLRRSLIRSLAATVGFGILAAPGVAFAASASNSVSRFPAAAVSPVAPTPVPPAQPVQAPPIADLPIAPTPPSITNVPVPDSFTGLKDPNTSPSGIPVNAVQLPPPSPSPSAPASKPAAVHPDSGLSSTFDGWGDTGTVPSDSNAAGGPYNVVEQVNPRLVIFSRSGTKVSGPFSLDTWYGAGSDSLFDPHTIFDPNGDRFIAIAEDGSTNSWRVSVSKTNDATGGWCDYSWGALNTGATSVDFPLVGVSPKYLMLTIRENGGGNRLLATPLSAVEGCQTAPGWTWSNVQNPGGGTADTLVPVLDYSTADTDSFLVNSYAGGGSDVSLYKFSDSGSSPGSLVSANVSTPEYAVASPGVQPGLSVNVDSGSAAITQAVNYSHGMYAMLTDGYPAGDPAVMWLEFNPSTQKLAANGLFDNSSLGFYYPSISEASNGTTMFTYSLSGQTVYPSSAVVGMDTSHNVTTNVYAHQGTFTTPKTGSKTCGGLPCSRWGDFTTTYTDIASNANAFWSASQDMASSSLWGTVIAYGSA